MNKGWEFRTLRMNTAGAHLDTESLDMELNELGKEGWELLTVSPILSGGETMFLVYHFRRSEERKQKAGFQP